MATLVLGALGTAIGGGIGGTFLGMSAASIGGLIGSSLGSMVDSYLIASMQPDQRYEGQRLESTRVTSSTEGLPIPWMAGRMRLGGNVIWATDFREEVVTQSQGGGKGGGPTVTTTEYKYYASFAVAICEGPVTGIGRVWADGDLLDPEGITWRWYPGDEAQEPDPFIQAKMGEAATPAYRGVCYAVFEELPLADFGNRLPQLTFEVFRPLTEPGTIEADLRAVCMIPGSGEFVYATTLIRSGGGGETDALNAHATSDKADFEEALDRLVATAPNLESVSLVVSWFGTDLRAGECELKPGVEVASRSTSPVSWGVNGLDRAAAHLVSVDELGRPVYGGTPSDASVIEAIQAIKARGLRVTFYPFILMDVPPGNSLPNPYSDNAATAGQPSFPWRGRITCSPAAGFAGSVDKTAAAATQVAALFGTAEPGDFAVSGTSVSFTGPADEWSIRRMILHYAHLCAAAGGVDAFLIGTEMRGLTTIRSAAATFPAVAEYVALAADARTILGGSVAISYAADWSEYFGHQPADGTGDVFFHLDPLWASAEIDFIGIDNYMPLSDWRDGFEHADAAAGAVSIYDQPYLHGNIEGGEGFDWFYASAADRKAQARTTISDGASAWTVSGLVLQAAGPTLEGAWADPTFRSSRVVFVGRAPFPTTPVDARLLKLGGSGFGTWLGVRGGGTVFRARAGSGASASASTSTPALLDVPVGDLPFDGQVHEIALEVVPGNPATLRLWIDGELIGSAATVGAPGFTTWSGGDTGRWLTGGASSVPTGEPTTDWPVTAGKSDLFAYSSIAQAATAEPWVYRYKDLRAWWSSQHRDRIGGVRQLLSTAWVPQSKPFRFTEFGCPAVDRGTNQPNVFFDPKSSESFYPYFSRGWRDETIQRAYLEATLAYWADPANNPVSSVYAAPMIDMDEAAAWAFDARPYPFFPAMEDVWSDGPNWRLGHWLSGRLGSASLPALVLALCRRAGLPDERIDVSGLWGAIEGIVLTALESPRSSLVPLMRYFGFDGIETNGLIRFKSRGRAPSATIGADDLVTEGTRANEDIEFNRAQETELPQALKWATVRADEEYDTAMVEARRITVQAARVAAENFPFAASTEESERQARRALLEAWAGREDAVFSLPPSRLALDAGDVLTIEHDGRAVDFRATGIAEAEARRITAVRQDREAYDAPPGAPRVASVGAATVYGAGLFEFLDLPALTSSDAAHQPILAPWAKPWPGELAVYRSLTDNGWALLTTTTGRAILGELKTTLPAGPTSRFDLAAQPEIELKEGTLASVTDLELFQGANAFAVETAPGVWEVIQAGTVTLVAPRRYRLSRLLRGQRGTEAAMGSPTLAGARVVKLDANLTRLPTSEGDIGVPWNWRIGASSKPVSGGEYATVAHAPSGAGLRPFSVAHVRQPSRRGREPGDLTIEWTRRSRDLAADSWELADAPLGEASEAYEVDVMDGSAVLRTLTSGGAAPSPSVIYSAAAQTADWGAPLGPGDSLVVRIAQISALVGRGAIRTVTLEF